MSYLDSLKSHFLEWTAGKWVELESLFREKDELIRLYELELSSERVKEIRIRVRLSLLALASQAQGSSSSSGPDSSRQGQCSSSASKSTPGVRSGLADKRKPKNKQKGLSSSITTGIDVGSPPVPVNIYEGHDGHGAGEAGGMDPGKPTTRPLSSTSAAVLLRQKLRAKLNYYRNKTQAVPKPLKMVPLGFPSTVPEPRRKPRLHRSKLRDLRNKNGTLQWSSQYLDLEVVDVDLDAPVVPLPTIPVTTSPAPGSARSHSGSATPNHNKGNGNVDVAPADSDEEEISVLEEIVKEGRSLTISSNQNGNGGGSARNGDNVDGGARPPNVHGRAPLTRFLDKDSGIWLSYYNCICGYRCFSDNSLERHLRSDWDDRIMVHGGGSFSGSSLILF